MGNDNKEKGCKWFFAKAEGTQDTGPNNAVQEFFKKNLHDSLVRESIQNSLDAVNDNSKPVKVVFRFKSISSDGYANLIDIDRYIQGCTTMFNTEVSHQRFDPMHQYIQGLNGNKMFCLEVADYNTKGMDYEGDDTQKGFYAFVRCVGQSSKESKNAGGSFGFGKAAYFGLSRIGTVLVSTKTTDNKVFFEGVSPLCTNKIGDQKYASVGFYDNNNGQPTYKDEDIPQMYRREECGSSVFIMGIMESTMMEDQQSMLKSVLQHFWMAIHKAKLEVEFMFEDDVVEVVKAENLAEIMEKNFPDMEDAKSSYKNPRPYFDAVYNTGKDSKHLSFPLRIQTIDNMFSNNRSVNLDDIAPQDGIMLYILKSKEAKDMILRMRSPLMVVSAKKNNTSYGFYAVLVCKAPLIDAILRSSENASHNEWDYKNLQSDRRDFAKQIIKELNDAIQEALKIAFGSSKTSILDIRGLEDYLYVQTTDDDDDDDDKYNEIYGTESGATKDSGNSPTSEVNPTPDYTTPKAKPASGKVIIGERMRATRNPAGKHLAGRSKRKIKFPGEGLPGHSLPNTSVEQDEDGTDGNYGSAVPVMYRSYAQTIEGSVIHKLIIRSETAVENGLIDIMTVGENNDERIEIIRSSVGQVRGNAICKLQLDVGKNEIEIQFADNIRHSLKLETYETK